MGLALKPSSLASFAELITPDGLDAFARQDFMTFVERVFAELNPGVAFEPGWHLELMASRLQEIGMGQARRCVINIPPRSLKSIMASIALPAWMMGRNPTTKIMVVSYGLDLAEELGRFTLQVMRSAWYRRMFPDTVLASNRQAASDFRTTKGGGRLASSFGGGSVTGRGADLIVIDDPIKPDEALSDTVRRNVNDYVASTLRNRFNNQNRGAILVVMQRLHEDDLSGHLLRKGWPHLSVPAIAEQNEVWTYRTPFGLRTVVRREGEALHPGRTSLEVLEQLRTDVGAYNFAAQYQQRPAPLGGGQVRLEYFSRYDTANPPKFDEVFQSWDTASKTGEGNDYSVCITFGRKGRKVWMLAVHRERMEYPLLKKKVLALRALYRPNRILIEDTASGLPLIQDLRHAGVHEIIPIKPRVEKAMRLNAVSTMIEAGDVYLPEVAHWLSVYEHEIALFPNAQFDDQVDATSQALIWLLSLQSSYEGWVDILVGQRGQIGGETRITLRGPPDAGRVRGISGVWYEPCEDGLFRMSQVDGEDAAQDIAWKIVRTDEDAP